MIQIIATLLTLAIAILSVTIGWAIIAQNQAAILSALAGRGAFPDMISPDAGPAALVPFIPRSQKRTVRRQAHTRRAENWSRAA